MHCGIAAGTAVLGRGASNTGETDVRAIGRNASMSWRSRCRQVALRVGQGVAGLCRRQRRTHSHCAAHASAVHQTPGGSSGSRWNARCAGGRGRRMVAAGTGADCAGWISHDRHRPGRSCAAEAQSGRTGPRLPAVGRHPVSISGRSIRCRHVGRRSHGDGQRRPVGLQTPAPGRVPGSWRRTRPRVSSGECRARLSAPDWLTTSCRWRRLDRTLPAGCGTGAKPRAVENRQLRPRLGAPATYHDTQFLQFRLHSKARSRAFGDCAGRRQEVSRGNPAGSARTTGRLPID